MNNFLNSTSTVPEFVGANEIGDTIGMVVPRVDQQLLDKLHVTRQHKTLGILSDRAGAGPQIIAMDEGIRVTSMECADVEWPRDIKGGGGHGCLIIIGGDDPAGACQAIRVALDDLHRAFGDVYNAKAGHLELQFTARAAGAAHLGLGTVEGKAFELICGCPSGIGVIMGDKALKTAGVKPLSFASPGYGTSFSNEGCLAITGDSGAVRQTVMIRREVGLKSLSQFGEEPVNDFPSYIK